MTLPTSGHGLGANATTTNASLVGTEYIVMVTGVGVTMIDKNLPVSQLDLRYDARGSAATAQSASLQKSSNLSDVANAATARGNLGCGSISTHDSADYVLSTAVGSASGVCPLDSGSKVPTANLPSAIVNGLEFSGTWNAATNSPTLASGVGTKGQVYVVATDGSTSLDGIATWSAADWAIFDGTVWRKVEGQAAQVLSVSGRTGNVVLSNTDISGLGSMALLSALPNPSASVLGGLKSSTSTSHQWVSYVDTSGTQHLSQPAFSDLSGSASVAQLPVMVGSGGIHAAGIVPDPGSIAGTTHYLCEDGTWSVPSAGGVLPLQTGSDPETVVKNAVGNSILDTDSSGRPILSDGSGSQNLLYLDTGTGWWQLASPGVLGVGNVATPAGVVIGNSGTFTNIVAGTLYLGAGASSVGFFGATPVVRQSLSLANVAGTGDDTDINSNFAAIQSVLQSYGLIT